MRFLPIFSKPVFSFSIIILISLLSFSSAIGRNYDFIITVLDENAAPLTGVNIYTDDYSFSTTTNLEGKATLKELSYRDEINFTYLGYQSKKLPFFEIRKLGGTIYMYPNTQELGEVVVIGRRDDTPEDLPYIIEEITKKEIAFQNPQTSADALANQGNVYVQKSQMGGGSPVIRGFEANKVLLVLDGVRMNNAIYREGHLQNSITVDNSMLERMEIIYGPGSLTYGSDALGGVVHFRSKDPKLFFATSGSDADYQQ